MRMHDIICDADGWAHYLDGVKQRTFPTWFMAMTAARKAAERDAAKGIAATFRLQGVDGEMHPVQTRGGAQGMPVEKPVGERLVRPEAQPAAPRLQA